MSIYWALTLEWAPPLHWSNFIERTYLSMELYRALLRGNATMIKTLRCEKREVMQRERIKMIYLTIYLQLQALKESNASFWSSPIVALPPAMYWTPYEMKPLALFSLHKYQVLLLLLSKLCRAHQITQSSIVSFKYWAIPMVSYCTTVYSRLISQSIKIFQISFNTIDTKFLLLFYSCVHDDVTKKQ